MGCGTFVIILSYIIICKQMVDLGMGNPPYSGLHPPKETTIARRHEFVFIANLTRSKFSYILFFFFFIQVLLCILECPVNLDTCNIYYYFIL